MLGRIATFEFRYQVGSPLFIGAALLLFLGAFTDMAVLKLVTIGGGQVLFNSPHAIIVSHLAVSMMFLFIGAAFVSNVIVRDEQTGFGPLIRSTRLTAPGYLLGRFAGAFAAGALVMLAATAGQWLGTLMPFADQSMLGPNRLAGFLYGYGLFALPNALIISAVLFSLATATRSTAGTFIGVIGLLFVYLLSQGLMQGRPQWLTFRVLADPLGMSAYMASSRYFTAAELNAGAIPVSGLMLQSRLLWSAIAVALLAWTCRRFRFREPALSRRPLRRLRRSATPAAAGRAAEAGIARAALPDPRFDRRTARAQFFARAAMEVRYIATSAAFRILLVMASLFTLASLMGASGWYGVPLYPLTAVSVPIIQASFDTLLVIIATYYGGELVWRERERNVDALIDATALPAWALMLPKLLGLTLVLLATLLAGMAVGLAVQWAGGVAPAPGDFLRWYLLPGAADALLVAALAVFVHALSRSKYAGWGIMALYLVLHFFGPSLGLLYPLYLYGSVPPVPLSDMAGSGRFAAAAWWFRLFWALLAVLLLLAAQLLWPRGADSRLGSRLRRLPARLTRPVRALALLATALLLLSGGWIIYNTRVLNAFHTPQDEQRYLADYEKRYFAYARLPQPVVRHVQLEVALYPEQGRAEVHGAYRLVNETGTPIEQVHVRLMNSQLALVRLDFPGARLERDDAAFGYRIYRLDSPMLPGQARSIRFHTRRQQLGFRAAGTETSLAPNGTDLDTLELTPRIGMSDVGLLEEPALRRQYGLPARRPFPALDDLAATRRLPGGDVSWTTADITVSTRADQRAVAPGRQVSEQLRGGRRIARFVSDTPIKNYFSIQSARYAISRQQHAGVDYAIYFDPAHRWNVERMMRAMQAAIDYCSGAFGRYQFDQARIVETPAYREGGQAFANTVPVGETASFAMDLRDPQAIDMVSMLTAHELAHQWWGHQVVGARMQGAGLLSETLAQYSALMVMRRLHGEAGIRPYLQFQLDRYLSGRRTQVMAEQPLASVEISQQHIAYGKGALVMYLLQARLGEAAVNRALRRLVERYRFTVAPYPRSLDLIGLLREQARTPAEQALITDLFERITLYEFKLQPPRAVRQADGRWLVSVPVEARKFYASGSGQQREAPLDEPVQVGLFGADPASALQPKDVLRLEWQPLHSGGQVLQFVTATRPAYVGVDPFNLYIDRNSADNVVPVQ